MGKEGRASLLSAVASEGTTGKGHKLKDRKIPCEQRFLFQRLTLLWIKNRFAQRSCSLHLGDIQGHTRHAPKRPVPAEAATCRGCWSHLSKDPFQPQLLCKSVNSGQKQRVLRNPGLLSVPLVSDQVNTVFP